MRNIRIDLQYDGTNYSGWQIQKNAISIQENIENALFSLTKEKIKVVGSGRTDAGVHAIHQVASFKTDSNIPPEKFYIALNSILPNDIKIIKSTEVDNEFHARYSAIRRTYKYVICDDEVLSPFKRHYCWHRKRHIDESILNRILQKIIGENNFSNLCSIKDESNNKIRTVQKIIVDRQNSDLNVYITANAFLRKMIRIIIGTAIKSIEKKLKFDLLYNIMISKVRNDFIHTAEPQGLFLYKVEY